MELTYDRLKDSLPPGTPYIAAISAVLAAVYFVQQRRLLQSNSGNTQQSAEKDRGGESIVLGEWRCRKFAYPKVVPLARSFTETKEVPYRPFRPGAYHVNMGLRAMPWDDWIELDDQYERYHAIRKNRIQSRGDKLIRVLGDSHNSQVKGGALAAIELVHELAEYLVARYPADFSVVRHDIMELNGKDGTWGRGELPTVAHSNTKYCDWGWEGAAPIKSITVRVLGETYDLPLHVNDGDRAPERALEISTLLVQDDLALMIEGKDERYYFQAGSILVPGFWRIQDKIGLPLDEIHTSGDVPQYREKLQANMERFFRRIPVDKPVSRNNYFFQVVRSEDVGNEGGVDPEGLAWSPANGSEDAFKLAHAFEEAQDTPTIDELRLRTERQTLRRLPISGAILFTIRVYLTPVIALSEEKGVPERLASALRGWPEDVKEYKGVYRGGWWETLLEFLDDKTEEQGRS